MSGEHARLMPSRAHRWVHCGGSVVMEATFPEEEGEEAQEGTAAHEVAAHLLRTGEMLPLGHVTSNGRVVDHAMLEGADLYANHVLSRLPADKNYALQIEQPVRCASIHPECWGTPDVRVFLPRVPSLDVWDYKYGHDFVEVFENWQLLCYVSGELDEILRDHPEIEGHLWVHMHIVQPRSYHRDGPVRTWSARAVDLRPQFNILTAAAARALGAPPAECRTGNHCNDCTAARACEALQRAAMSAASYAASAVPFNLPAAAAGRELQTLVARREVMSARITGLQAQIEGELRAGNYVPFWQLGFTKPRERWSRSVEEVAAMGELFGRDLRAAPELITPAQARKAGIAEEVVAAYSFRPKGEAKLVPMDTTDTRKIFS